ncbi:SpoIIE family protein phosphatase [Streptomyces sp. Je 1-79]|uniref:ATP-binding SpoIIE family protein phosphatase n=1 Tax=Streptomyces sp. Je 1-79 TaxID=2943847 RepID=UPI0021A5D073|nr:SpoIIE family protein phosphatase [Streptomyces sp. Je 1-79]MCT4353417.1 SpoIIE family protein phosphatase [Streptomyces sp. Je 1-79]
MATDVDAFLRRLAQELRPRVNESADVLLRRMRSELPELWRYDDLSPMAVEETAGHVTAFLDVLEHGLDVTQARTPPSAVEVARRFARSGVPISKLLRAYRLGHVSLLQLAQSTAAGLTDDWELINASWLRLIAMGFEYVDRASEQVVAAYQQERDRRLQRRLVLTNEASRRIGTTLDTARTAQELADVGVDDFADLVTVDLLESLLQAEGAHLPSGPSVLRRIAQQSVLEGCPDSAIAAGRTHTYPEECHPARALASGQPLLLRIMDTGVPAWWSPDPERSGALSVPGIHSVLVLPLLARGSTLGLAQFFRHRTAAPFDEDDLLLAQEIAARAAVYIDNARRYTHERSTALTLQRSLLPQRAVEQSAVVAASRYLPSGSRAGVGGDWYDIIPLSGARVALVVGDVVGRGLHAAATMGGLRTAVRAFADIDLMPDELLTHLDDVVIRLQREEAPDAGETSATCLYAIYDPVSRMCSVASAGHVLPAVATPLAADGDSAASTSVGFPDMPIGPPLGLGGLPFETAQFELPEGSLLALYTDGLIESRTRDVDTSRAMMCEVLAQAPDAPEDICERLLSALLPHHPSDDVALLVARTRALDPGHVATLDIPPDPAAVSEARVFAAGRLTAWGLDELSFTTELIVSELVTNAIRYAKPPVQLRLIVNSTLTCEVSDASSTAPHLRRARTFDEGGRGLLLVAQLAERWGARHSREGKVIWAEQALPGVVR